MAGLSKDARRATCVHERIFRARKALDTRAQDQDMLIAVPRGFATAYWKSSIGYL